MDQDLVFPFQMNKLEFACEYVVCLEQQVVSNSPGR